MGDGSWTSVGSLLVTSVPVVALIINHHSLVALAGPYVAGDYFLYNAMINYCPNVATSIHGMGIVDDMDSDLNVLWVECQNYRSKRDAEMGKMMRYECN